MNKAEEYRKIAEVVMEQNRKKRSEACIRNREKSEQCTFWAKVQYKRILRKMKKIASRGEYVYKDYILTTSYVVNKLREDGFKVHAYVHDGSKHCRLCAVRIPEF